MARRLSSHTSTYDPAGGVVHGVVRFIVVVSCLVAVSAMFYGLVTSDPASDAVTPTAVTTPALSGAASATLPAPTVSPNPGAPTDAPVLPTPAITPSPDVPHVGIVAGHLGHDSGAVCDDGLREVDVNLDVAERVVSILETRGYRADLLEEYDAQLQGYRADALVSIHADSCVEYANATPSASGFKVASVVDSVVPEEEERLVACLIDCYQARTGMFFHANSITDDMRRYGRFYLIDGYTPAAIIEIGFMFADREMLTQRAHLIAQGVVEGIVCFVEDASP